MRLSSVRRGMLLALAIGAAACTTPPTTAPTAPVTTLTPITNPTPKVNGVFQGPMLLSFVGGGSGALDDVGLLECVGTEMKKRVNTDINNASLSLTQPNTDDPTIVNGTLNSDSTGLSCSYTGTIGSANSITMNGAGCQSGLQILCPRLNADGTTTLVNVQFSMTSTTMSGAFDGWPVNVSAMRGSVAQTYKIDNGGGSFVVRYGSTDNPIVLTKK